MSGIEGAQNRNERVLTTVVRLGEIAHSAEDYQPSHEARSVEGVLSLHENEVVCVTRTDDSAARDVADEYEISLNDPRAHVAMRKHDVTEI